MRWGSLGWVGGGGCRGLPGLNSSVGWLAAARRALTRPLLVSRTLESCEKGILKWCIVEVLFAIDST